MKRKHATKPVVRVKDCNEKPEARFLPTGPKDSQGGNALIDVQMMQFSNSQLTQTSDYLTI
jgi:hypothetical protein